MSRKLVPLLIVIAGISALMWKQMQKDPPRISGFLESDEIRVGSRVGGRVSEVLVQEGQTVREHDFLVRLEPFDLMERLAEAKGNQAAAAAEFQKLSSGYRAEDKARAIAQRDQANAQLNEAKAGPRKQEIQEARDNLAVTESDLQLVEQNFRRAEELFSRKTISREEYDRNIAERKASRARNAVAKSRLELLLEGTRTEQIEQAKAKLAAAESDVKLYAAGYRAEEIAQAKAQLESAKARVEAIQTQLSELEIRSPCNGIVEAIDLRPGDLVPSGAPVLSITDTRRMWVRAFVPQSNLGLTPLGKKLNVHIDSAPGKVFLGKVVYVAQQAEFTPDNVQTPEERSKQVFRIKVELEGDHSMLRPGMTADMRLDEPESK